MNTNGYALFPTAMGQCAIAWGSAGVRAVLLPESSSARTRVRLAQRIGSDVQEVLPTELAHAAITAIQALLAGTPTDLAFIRLDMAGVADFNVRVYAIARQVMPGQTRTYGSIARELGDVGLARAVGTALGRNPFPIVVPCHRVLGADGRMTGFSAPGGVATKQRMLEIEGVRQARTLSLLDDTPRSGE